MATELQNMSNDELMRIAGMGQPEQAPEAEAPQSLSSISDDELKQIAGVSEPSFSGGLATGALGEKIGETLGASQPTESKIADRVKNHGSYYAGYALGKLGQIGLFSTGAGALGAGLEAAVPAFEGVSEAFPVLSGALNDAAVSAASKFADTADAKDAAQAAGAGAVLGTAFRGLGSLMTPEARESAELGAKSLANSTKAIAEQMPDSFEEYLNKVNDLAPNGPSPAAATWKAAKDYVIRKIPGLREMVETGSLRKNLADVFNSVRGVGSDPDQAIIDSVYQEAKDGYASAIPSRIANIKDRPLYQQVEHELATARGVLYQYNPKAVPMLDALANEMVTQFKGLSNKWYDLEKELNPGWQALEEFNKRLSSRTGGQVDLSFLRNMVNMYAKKNLVNVEAPELQSLGYENMTGMDPINLVNSLRNGLKYQKAVLDNYGTALDKLADHPAIQAIVDLGKTDKIDSSQITDLLGHAENLYREMGLPQTHAENALKLMARARGLTDSPEMADSIAKAHLLSMKAFKEGDYDEVGQIANKVFGISDAIKERVANLKYPALETMVPGTKQVMASPLANLPAIASYNQGRASTSGARQATNHPPGLFKPTAAQKTSEDIGE